MQLKLFESQLQETKKINRMTVDWDFPTVTILGKAGNSKPAGSGGMTPDSAKTEIIDPENMDQSQGDSSEGGGNDNNQNNQDEVKVGSIIQDFTTGKYGRVKKVDKNGGVEWDPVDEDELRKEGFLSLKQKTKKQNITNLRRIPDEFVG